MSSPMQQHGIGGLVDGEAPGGQGDEPEGGLMQLRTVPAKGPEMMPDERNPEGGHPAEHVGAQGIHAGMLNQQHHDNPVHRRGGAADQQEPVNAPGRPVRLCICVDDFGLHPGINAAALDLVARGVVHALACQVGGNAWRVGASQLRHFRGVDVGLHLDLTEKPLRSAPQSLWALITRSLMRRLDDAALEVEIAAQLDRFENTFGRTPDFVDGHQHVHQLPQVREALLAALQRRSAHRPWLRNTRRRLPLPGFPFASFKPWLIEQLGAAELQRQARGAGFQRNEALLGVYDFTPSVLGYAAFLQEWLPAAKDGDLLMCHPSKPVDCQTDSILAARLAEFEVLAGVGFGVLIGERNITLTRMSRTLAERSR